MPYPIKSHCPQGHEYTPENTGRDNRGARFCRECTRIRARAYKKAHPEMVAKHGKMYRTSKDKLRARSRARGLYASTQFADGVAAERAAIVAWLKELSELYISRGQDTYVALEDIAENIHLEEHHK